MADPTRTQHQSIDYAIVELNELLDEPWEPYRIEPSVQAFARVLQEHFEDEERSYLFTGFLEDYPRFEHEINTLRMEHVEMLDEVRSIAAGLHELPRDVVTLRLRALMARLGLHESHEIDLLQSAHTDDLAPMD